MEKKINPKMFADRLDKWQKEIEATIIEVMAQQGIKAISLLDNGSDSRSVDVVYGSFLDDEDNEIKEERIGIIYIENNKNLIVVPENKIKLNDVDKISEKGDVFSPKAWDSLYNTIDLYGNYDYITSEYFSPTDTLMSIASTVTEIIEVNMKEKPLANGETIKIF